MLIKKLSYEYYYISDKPQRKSNVAIAAMNPFITFYATKEAIEDFKEFGHVITNNNHNRCQLDVDSRYDYNEVLAYIKNWG